MKGVVLGPIMAAILTVFVTGSSTAGVIVFFVGLGVMAVLITGELGLVFRRFRR
jgi:hypothetical protein